jgi:CubicO group peptidase (beta-lactamase class C family)
MLLDLGPARIRGWRAGWWTSAIRDSYTMGGSPSSDPDPYLIPTLLRISLAACLWALPAAASPERDAGRPAMEFIAPSRADQRADSLAAAALHDRPASFARTVRLGQDPAAWRRTADSLRAQGYRPLSLDAEILPDGIVPLTATATAPGSASASVPVSAKASGLRAVFATVWERKPGPAWTLVGPASGTELLAELARWEGKGYRPYAIAALASGPVPGPQGIAYSPTALSVPATPGIPVARAETVPAAFAVLMVKDGLPASARFDLDQDAFQAACDSARKTRAKCDWIEAYGDPARPRFAAVFARDSAGTPWNYSLGDDTASWRLKRDIFARVWVRPARMAPMPGGRFATVWEENSAGAEEFHPDMDAAAIEAACARDAGPRAVAIRIWPGAPGRFALSAAEQDSPLPREWTVDGPAAPGLEAFDGYMRNLMRARGVRGGTLSIAREGRLVFAHGYTWAEPGYPRTSPNSLFRAASCSKPLTSILVHKMLREAEGRNEGPSLKEKILSLLHGGSETPDAPADARFGDITVDELLTHSAGWIRSRNHPDPVFNDYPPGSDIRKRLPADRSGFLSYMLRQPLQFAPGSRSVYDNFGYFLLGRMLESLPMGAGKTYRDIAEDLLFKPLGLSRPRFGGSRMEERAAGEVLYHTAVPYLQANPIAGGAPWVAGGYGDFEVGNMDAAGAWLLSAPDYAKVLAAFDLDAGNPILGPQATATMWGPSRFGEALRGWFALKIPSGKGDTAVAKWHNGLFPGTSTLVFYHPEKWSFVMFLNRDLSPQPDGPHEGRDLARLASRVGSWPRTDLFPAMGIPPFQQAAIGPELLQANARPGPPAEDGNGADEEDSTAADPAALAGDPK